MRVQRNALDYLTSLKVSNIQELEGIDPAEVEIIWWRVGNRTWEESRLARRIGLVLVECLDLHTFVLRDFFKVVGVLEDVKVVHDVKLLVAHVEDVEVRRPLRSGPQLDDLQQVLILLTLPEANGSIVKGNQNGTDRLPVREVNA